MFRYSVPTTVVLLCIFAYVIYSYIRDFHGSGGDRDVNYTEKEPGS